MTSNFSFAVLLSLAALSGFVLFILPTTPQLTANLIWFTSSELSLIQGGIAKQCALPQSPLTDWEEHLHTCCVHACAKRFEFMRRKGCETRCVMAATNIIP